MNLFSYCKKIGQLSHIGQIFATAFTSLLKSVFHRNVKFHETPTEPREGFYQFTSYFLGSPSDGLIKLLLYHSLGLEDTCIGTHFLDSPHAEDFSGSRVASGSEIPGLLDPVAVGHPVR